MRKEQHESHKITSPNQNLAIISSNDVVLTEQERKPTSTWKIGIIVEFTKGKNEEVPGATARARKSNSLITRRICKLYHIVSMHQYSYNNFEGDNVMSEKPKRFNY